MFDLDPGAPAGLQRVRRVALLIREIFDAFGLRTFVKTSGVKGLQVYVPLNAAVTTSRPSRSRARSPSC